MEAEGFLDPEGVCNSNAFPEVCDTTTQATRVNRAWEYVRTLGPMQSPVFVAIVDDGYAVDANGQQLFGNLDLPNTVFRWNFNVDTNNITGAGWNCNPMTDPPGRCWHGTAVANVATATINNQFGAAGTGSPVAQPFLFKITGSYFQAARAFRTAVSWGADVINASFGGNCNWWCNTFGDLSGEGPLNDAAKTASSAGVAVVASAGNDSKNLFNEYVIPCEQSDVLCVGALDFDSLNAAGFSNFGPGVNIWAPGASLRVAPLPAFVGGTWINNSAGFGINDLSFFGGTSAASPFVAGVVATMKAVDPSLGVRDVQQIIQNTANSSSTDPKVSPRGSIDAFSAVYETADTTPVGTLASPANGSDWWGSMPLSVTLCNGCTANTVQYFARYDKGDGQGRQAYSIAFVLSNSGNNFSTTWDLTGVPFQNGVEVWAELSSRRNTSSTTPVNSGIGLNIDSVPPWGQITEPSTNSTHGDTVRLAAQVGDAHSGVDRVEFSVHTTNGWQPVQPEGTPANNFTVIWNSAGLPSQTISVRARVFDQQDNFADLTLVTDVVLDHDPPAVSMVYPPQAPAAAWITGTGSIQVTAQASDPTGIQEVIFRARYWNVNGDYVEQTIGSDQTPNFYGDYSVIWDVSNIPDQVDRNLHDLIVLADAVDAVGNVGAQGLGWITGFDREAPQVTFVSPATDVVTQNGTLAIEVEAIDNLSVANRVHQLTVNAHYRDAGQSSPTNHLLADLFDVHSWTSNFDLSSLPSQIMTLTARAEDEAGNERSIVRRITIDRSGPTVTVLGHNPDPFYANGSRSMSFSYRLSEWASTVRIIIADTSAGSVHELLFNNVAPNPQVQVANWDGKDKFGNLFPSGQYTYEFEASDVAGNITTQSGGSFSIVSDTSPPNVVVTVDPTYSLASSGPLKILYDIDEDSYVEIEIFDISGAMVNYLGVGNQKAGADAVFWYGDDFVGNKVPTIADYRIRVRATDLAGNVAIEETWVTVTP